MEEEKGEGKKRVESLGARSLICLFAIARRDVIAWFLSQHHIGVRQRLKRGKKGTEEGKERKKEKKRVQSASSVGHSALPECYSDNQAGRRCRWHRAVYQLSLTTEEGGREREKR